jgi:hypothetical protein
MGVRQTPRAAAFPRGGLQYEVVDVRTSRGVRRAMLFPKLILQAEFAANATVSQRMAIKRKQLRAMRPAKQVANRAGE